MVSGDSSSGSEHNAPYLANEKETAIEHAERIKTNERVPGHTNYYEKNGVRTESDGVDHEHVPAMTGKRAMAMVAMAFLWTGSQIPVYLFGGIPPYIYGDIGGTDRWIWFILANLLSLAAVCPFVGSLSDLFGRRYVAIGGSCSILLGMIVCSTAQTMNIFICGMTFAGIGAGVLELTALAAVSELAPTRQRGVYVAGLIFTILPFCPSVMYGQLIAHYSSWRYVGLLCGIWNLIGLVLTVVFYHPPARVNSAGLTRKETLAQIDYLGGFLSIGGMLLFMMGMQWGGYQYAWTSVHTLVPLVLGAVLLAAFVVWEGWFAPYPMFPKRMWQEPRTIILTLVITFISGANFFAILMFWPTQAFNVYGHDPVGVGLRGMPIGFAILTGALVCLILLSVLRGGIRTLLIVSSVLMTAGTGALACAEIDNLHVLWGLLILAGLGIGGIVVPASIITTIICPDDIIATVTALTLAIRVIGGSVGYCIYYNVFYNKFVPRLTIKIVGAMAKSHVYNATLIKEAAELTGASLIDHIALIPGLAGNQTKIDLVVRAGQLAFAEAYKYVYYASIAFGAVSIIAACFLGDIEKYMDDHVAVVM